MDYEIRVTKEQACTLQKCLEFYARILMGQFDEIKYGVMDSPVYEKMPQHDIDAFSDALKDLQKLFTGATNTYYGIAGDMSPKDAKIAWDLYQVVRHRIAWDEHPEGYKEFYSVSFSDPSPVSQEPLAEMKKVDKEDQ